MYFTRRFCHLVTIAEALQRVFVPAHELRQKSPPLRRRILQTCIQQHRHVSFFGRGRQVGPAFFRAGPLRDEEIRAHEVHVVDSDGTLSPAQPLSHVLNTFDRTKNFLVQVSPPDSSDTPVCKIIDKQEAREKERAKARPVKSRDSLTKRLELNWAIDANDLGHRMNKMKEFLEQGRRVEILMARKRKGRTTSDDEAQRLVEQIKKCVGDIEGAKEWKAMDGKVGLQATLYIDGKAKK